MADKADKRLPDESDMLLAKIEELKRQIKVGTRERHT